MTEVKAYAPGIHARSEELVQATRDLDRGRATAEDVAERQSKDVRAFLEAQCEAEVDYFSDGLLNWQDILRPLNSGAEGLQPGPLTRFLNTNTFFRAPATTDGAPHLPEPLGEEYFRAYDLPRGRWVATLPSPYTFARLSDGERELTAQEVAEDVLAPQLGWLSGNGCALVVLQETELPKGDTEPAELEAALEALQSPLPVALQLPFGDAGGTLAELATLPVEAIGVDFYATDADSLPRPFPKTLLAGVIDARNSLLEEPEELAQFGKRLLEELEGPGLHLVPNGDLQFVPPGIAQEKVMRLGEAAQILREG